MNQLPWCWWVEWACPYLFTCPTKQDILDIFIPGDVRKHGRKEGSVKASNMAQNRIWKLAPYIARQHCSYSAFESRIHQLPVEIKRQSPQHHHGSNTPKSIFGESLNVLEPRSQEPNQRSVQPRKQPKRARVVKSIKSDNSGQRLWSRDWHVTDTCCWRIPSPRQPKRANSDVHFSVHWRPDHVPYYETVALATGTILEELIHL